MRTLTLLPALLFVFGVTGPDSGPVQAQTGARPFQWSNASSGYRFRWNDRDLTAVDAATGKTVYSVSETVRRQFGKPTPEDVVTYYEAAFAPLSIVGHYLSYRRNDAWEGGAHPSGTGRFVTVDVRNPERTVTLKDIFPAETIRAALLKDAVVRRVLRREKIASPATLDALVKALAYQKFGGEEDNMYLFPSNLLETFAFHHMENGSVAVRFLLPHGSEIHRFRSTQIGILLPIPVGLKSDFARAAVGKEGVLMQSLQRSEKDRLTTVVVQNRKGVSTP